MTTTGTHSSATPLADHSPHLRDVSVSAVVAGLIAVLVSYSGPFVVVLAAARAANLPGDVTTSWVWPSRSAAV